MREERIKEGVRNFCDGHLQYIAYAFPDQYENFVSRLAQYVLSIYREGLYTGRAQAVEGDSSEEYDIFPDSPHPFR